jgi:5-methyltetrahydropteroyltriglutamate--homocysteine methyltransferase
MEAVSMVELYDSGSMPFVGDFRKLLDGAAAYLQSSTSSDQAKYFEKEVVKSFLDKVRAGVEIPNYPQFRDMNEMFLESMKGVEKVEGGYIEAGILGIQMEKTCIPEVSAIKNNSAEIHDKTGQPVRLRVCVTGPYTLSCLFTYRDSGTFTRIGEVISRIVESNLFHDKHGSVSLVALDEPTFGLLDDPLLDYGAEGRETLRKAWESIFHKASVKGVQTSIHLHSTVDELFWDVKTLNVVESHVEDPLYQSDRTKKLLESMDKFLKASIGISDFDKLIRKNITASLKQSIGEPAINEQVAEAWKKITNGKLDPTTFLESIKLMEKRFNDIISRFDPKRIPYAGPECGLKSFPTYECALECLRRISNTVKKSRVHDPQLQS